MIFTSKNDNSANLQLFITSFFLKQLANIVANIKLFC